MSSSSTVCLLSKPAVLPVNGNLHSRTCLNYGGPLLFGLKCLPKLKPAQSMPVYSEGGEGMAGSDDAVTRKFRGQSTEDVSKYQIEKRECYEEGGGGDPPGGKCNGCGGSGGSEDGEGGLGDEISLFVFATMGIAFVYVYIINGQEITNLAEDYIRYLMTGKNTSELERAMGKRVRLGRGKYVVATDGSDGQELDDFEVFGSEEVGNHASDKRGRFFKRRTEDEVGDVEVIDKEFDDMYVDVEAKDKEFDDADVEAIDKEFDDVDVDAEADDKEFDDVEIDNKQLDEHAMGKWGAFFKRRNGVELNDDELEEFIKETLDDLEADSEEDNDMEVIENVIEDLIDVVVDDEGFKKFIDSLCDFVTEVLDDSKVDDEGYDKSASDSDM